MRIVILGLSITSSWGNGHATTYRGLVRELARRGHDVLFLERDVPWYAENRDMPQPPYGRTELYASVSELKRQFLEDVREADLVMVGSFVPDGIEVGEWVVANSRGITAFYDIDTPVTLARLDRGDNEYLSLDLIPRYQLYLSFTGGPMLERIERHYGSPRARVLYCSVDPGIYYPEARQPRWDLGYLGTFSQDRQPFLECLMLTPARLWKAGRFIVTGPLYPENIRWPENVERIQHLPPAEHRGFYNSQRLTLNITRADMSAAGYSPSVRLFEAAACGTPILTDYWPGLETIFDIGRDVLVTRGPSDTLRCLRELPAEELRSLGLRARARVLREHTPTQRAEQLENYLLTLGLADAIAGVVQYNG